MSNAPMFTKPGDEITIAILATSAPLGRGNSEGFALRHLRLRFALRHTFSRMPMYGAVTGLGQGTGLHGAREFEMPGFYLTDTINLARFGVRDRDRAFLIRRYGFRTER